MRDYAKISPTFWTGATGKAIVKSGPECVAVAFHLLTSPHANALGHYYIPIPFIAHETALDVEGASKALRRVCEEGFCAYDDVSEVVWVFEMAKHQVGESLKQADNRVKKMNKLYASLPKSPFLYDLFVKYKDAFHLEIPRGLASPFEGASKALRSQEQEQEQEQDKKNTAGPDPPEQPSAPSVFVLNNGSGGHFRQYFESNIGMINKACGSIAGLPEKDKPFNPFQAVQWAVKSGMHPVAIASTISQMAEAWSGDQIKNPWGWWRQVLRVSSPNEWEKEDVARAEAYKRDLAMIAEQSDILELIGLKVKTIGGKKRAG